MPNSVKAIDLLLSLLKCVHLGARSCCVGDDDDKLVMPKVIEVLKKVDCRQMMCRTTHGGCVVHMASRVVRCTLYCNLV